MSLAGAAAQKAQIEALIQTGCVSKGDWLASLLESPRMFWNESPFETPLTHTLGTTNA